MRHNNIIALSLLLLVFTSCKKSDLNTEPQSFIKNWLFFKGEAQGAEHINYDDTQWRPLDLPHDWAIEGPFDIKYNARCGGCLFMVLDGIASTFKFQNLLKGNILHFILMVP